MILKDITIHIKIKTPKHNRKFETQICQRDRLNLLSLCVRLTPPSLGPELGEGAFKILKKTTKKIK